MGRREFQDGKRTRDSLKKKLNPVDLNGNRISIPESINIKFGCKQWSRICIQYSFIWKGEETKFYVYNPNHYDLEHISNRILELIAILHFNQTSIEKQRPIKNRTIFKCLKLNLSKKIGEIIAPALEETRNRITMETILSS